jgi:hypothetical protein
MSRIAGGVLAVLLALPALAADDKPKDKPQTPKEQYEALVKEYNDQMQEFQKAYSAAKTDEERNKAFSEKYPKPDKLTPKFLELAEKNPKDPAAIDALVWVVNYNRGQPGKDNPRAKALEILLRDHPDSDKVGTICMQMAYDYEKSAETFLRTVLEKNKNKDVQGQATLALAQYLKRRGELVGQIKDHPDAVERIQNFLGKDYVEELKKADVAKLNKDVEGLFDTAISKYGDVKAGRSTIGKQAEGELFELRNLVVGKAAPEVEGEDIEGSKFKLSDYKGKVVLIDFWGNW